MNILRQRRREQSQYPPMSLSISAGGVQECLWWEGVCLLRVGQYGVRGNKMGGHSSPAGQGGGGV